MFILEEVLEKCKLSDPEGMYELEVKELSYRVEGDVDENDENEEEISKMFFRLHVMPSASKHWWKHCRKIMSADAAHLRGQLDNVVNMLTAKDANDQNFTLMYTICGNEDGANFHSTLSRASAALGNDITVLVSDRIMTVEKEMQQDQLQGCVFTHCALHIAKNTGITKSVAITIITKMAKAPNAETFEKYAVELRLQCNEKTVNFMIKNKELYAYHAIKAREEAKAGVVFFTNYGQCNNNASEQQNNKHKDFRDMPYVSALLLFLKGYNEQIFDRFNAALKMEADGMEVVDKIVQQTMAAAVEMTQRGWNFQTVNIDRDTDNNNAVTRAVFLVTRKNSNNQVVQHTVALFPSAPNWYNRIDCACGPCSRISVLHKSISRNFFDA